MPLFRPFSSGSSRQTVSLFEIRPESNFVVFRGNEAESTSQILKGVVVLCVSSPIKVEQISLRLTGTLRLSYHETRLTAPGITTAKTVRNETIYEHVWPPFVGGPPGSAERGRGTVLKAGNYEWPFEVVLAGDMAESVEGLEKASITYRLKAVMTRGKLSSDRCAYKHLRVVRTLDPAALEFVHAMSVENIWPNKIDYSICVPRKAVVFGGKIPLEMRFTPLLKGLDMTDIYIQLQETQELFIQAPKTGAPVREFREEREVGRWHIAVSRQQHWCPSLDEFGQEGWTVNGELDLPKKLKKCLQDANLHGIKIRHKLKIRVALSNPDGHISELRATLPISIFISPNIPLDEEGNIVSYDPANPLLPAPDTGSHIAPPGYGEHILDQLYDDIDISHLQTPAVRSGATTPYLGHSRTVSAENLPTASSQQQQAGGITAAALRSRLADLPPADSRRNTMYSVTTPSICITESPASGSSSSSSSSSPSSPADAALEPALTRTSSAGTGASSRTSSSSSASDSVGPRTPPAAVMPEIQALSRVPSYATAVKTPARPLSYAGPSGSGSIPDELLPDYLSAVMMAPGGEAAAARPATAAATPAPAAEGGSAGRRSSMLLSLPSLGRTPSSQADTRRPGLRSRLGITNGTSGSGSAGRRASTLGFSMLHARLGERVM